jgi:hypothetical protein
VTPDLSAPTARDAGEAVVALAQSLQEASAIEFRASPKPRVWESDRTSGGGDGRPADPTAAVAADARRLAVRAAVLSAYRDVVAAERRLDLAVRAWHGSAPLPEPEG